MQCNVFIFAKFKAMSAVSITNVTVLDNPASFLTPFQFEISYECLTPLKDGIFFLIELLVLFSIICLFFSLSKNLDVFQSRVYIVMVLCNNVEFMVANILYFCRENCALGFDLCLVTEKFEIYWTAIIHIKVNGFTSSEFYACIVYYFTCSICGFNS